MFLVHIPSKLLFLLLLTANGDVIVSLLPLNEGWDWVTPAKFKAHLVPEELMAQSLTVILLGREI